VKYFRLVWRNVFRKKLRTSLTASSIIIVLTLIVILASLLQAMQADPSGGRGANRLVVQHATGLGNFLPLSQRQRIEQIPGVVAVSPELWFGGVYKDDKPENWIGQLSTDPDIYFDKIFDDATIDPKVNAEWKATRNGFVAGASSRRSTVEAGRPHHPEGDVHPSERSTSSTSAVQRRRRVEHLLSQRVPEPVDWFGRTRYTGSTT
jgi:putative ABC transport system permease protein